MESKHISLLPCADHAALGEIKAAFTAVPSFQSWAVVLLSREESQVDSSTPRNPPLPRDASFGKCWDI